jgi:uncharacterized membrane protein YfcA
MTQTLQYIAVGLAGGTLAGLLGIGGAIIVIPLLVYVFGFDQKLAQGTTLAMLIPPVGLLAAWQYYQQNAIDLKAAGILCIGMFIGGYFGGYIATHLPSDVLRKVFGVALILIALKMIAGK